ncbi:MAG: DUF4389 domain-containing protein [Deltaproteobacteria bacterium]|nr:DUF4389 domain-containing protein [Deltaproteobacteria bacterium]MBW2391441.1 DUF4389 domain-containing protein [Deltaproteobacteria bacterium]MBW2725026.1 DUF4389 domain-containing protein [Deltaproteobacteria bacterium]
MDYQQHPKQQLEPQQVRRQEHESIWVRGLYMLLFVLIYGVAEVVVTAVCVIQFGWVVATEERNPRLERFGGSLSEFVYHVVRYWTFVSDERPFPFTEWPAPKAGEAA